MTFTPPSGVVIDLRLHQFAAIRALGRCPRAAERSTLARPAQQVSPPTPARKARATDPGIPVDGFPERVQPSLWPSVRWRTVDPSKST